VVIKVIWPDLSNLEKLGQITLIAKFDMNYV